MHTRPDFFCLFTVGLSFDNGSVGQSLKRIVQFFATAAAALAVPLCVNTMGFVVLALSELTESLHWRTWPGGLYFVFILTSRAASMLVGFAVVVRALRPRWVLLTVVALAYFPFMFEVLEISAYVLGPMFARINCKVPPGGGGCWP